MDWQVVVVFAALALALGYLSRSAWRTWFGPAGKGCASGCGGCAKPANQPQDQRRIALPRV
ncbi:MAG TPA: hypothetical protein VFG68_19835 [Fimbriiglobus sp.]|nr:hypothetical protein [Fimbriiglobus sp.]